MASVIFCFWQKSIYQRRNIYFWLKSIFGRHLYLLHITYKVRLNYRDRKMEEDLQDISLEPERDSFKSNQQVAKTVSISKFQIVLSIYCASWVILNAIFLLDRASQTNQGHIAKCRGFICLPHNHTSFVIKWSGTNKWSLKCHSTVLIYITWILRWSGKKIKLGQTDKHFLVAYLLVLNFIRNITQWGQCWYALPRFLFHSSSDDFGLFYPV